MNLDRTSGFIFGATAAVAACMLVLAVLLAPLAWIASNACETRWRPVGLRAEWRLGSGCVVEIGATPHSRSGSSQVASTGTKRWVPEREVHEPPKGLTAR